MELQLLMLLKRKAMAKIHRSSVTSQMSRHFDTSPQLKDKPKKSTHKIMFKRHYRIHAPLCKQSKCLLQPPRVKFSGFFIIKKKRRITLLLTVTFQQKLMCHCWGEAQNIDHQKAWMSTIVY